MNINNKIGTSVLLTSLAAGAVHGQAVTYDSNAKHDFAKPQPAVGAGQTVVNGWMDQAGQLYSVADGNFTATTSDTSGYLHGLALRPASENSDTPNVKGTISVPNGLPSAGTANGLVLRYQPDGTFYLFQLSPDTLYAYKITKGSTVTRLQAASVQPDAADPYSMTGSVVTTAAGVSVSVSAVDTRTGKLIGSFTVPDYSNPIMNAGQVGVDSWAGGGSAGTFTESYSRVVFSRLVPPVPSKAFPKVGFIGDSITAGYNQYGNTITPGVNDAATLTLKALATTKGTALVDTQIPWSAYDQGVSGSSTGDWRSSDPNSRAGRAKTAFSLAFGKPDPKTNPVWVMVMLGTNDVRSDNHDTPQQHQSHLQALTDDLVAGGYNVILNHAPAFVVPTSFNGVTWDADGLSLLQSYLPGEQAVVASYAASAPGRVFLGDTTAFTYFGSHPELFQEYGHYGGLHPNGNGGTAALASFWAKAFSRVVSSH